MMIRAGIFYFALVFLAGTAFGVVRTLLVVPHTGPLLAVMLELPFMLVISWSVCLWAMRRYRVPNDIPTRAAIGLIAFGLLVAAEFALFAGMTGIGPMAYFSELSQLTNLPGLLGQVMFGLIPVLQRKWGASPSPL